jgi:hypothetical protein
VWILDEFINRDSAKAWCPSSLSLSVRSATFEVVRKDSVPACQAE